MGLTEFAREGRVEPHEKLNGSRPPVDDKDVFISLSVVISNAVREGVKEGVREAMLDIPFVRAWRWITKKLKQTR